MQFSYGVFLPYMMRELGISLSAATAPFSLYVLIYSLMCFVSGPATDRLGPRVVVLSGGVLLGLAYLLLGATRSTWQIYVFFTLLGGVGMSVVFVPLNATVVRWFIQRRGLALAITGTGSNAALLFGPMSAAILIPWLGWRTGLMALGLFGGLVIAFCALALARDPESRGLRPDGEAAAEQSRAGANTSRPEVSWTLGEARSVTAFWIIMGVYVLTWAMLFFPYVHLAALAVMSHPMLKSAR